ncbi:MAG TPA: hypothetical protein VEU52_07340 [Candidatus Limnocylindrales bacterium]|nr:hypothetical protein [Candidatus Limnocylindrales bacterium]
MPARLLRTIQIGVPQGITAGEIKKLAESDNTDYMTALLARSALLVLQRDIPQRIEYDELYEGVLNHLVPDGNTFIPPRGLENFRGKELALAMTYSLVMSGKQEHATDILGQHLKTGSKFKHAVILSALRNIGTQRAKGIIQKYGEAGEDRNLAENTLADEDYPVLSEMYDRWNLVPPAARSRDNLRTIVQGGCDQRTAMASYWLGFFAPNPDPNAEEAELQALEKIAHTNTPTCEMMEHVIALKSLGLRSKKTIPYWTHLAGETSNVWERHQIVINAWGRWGRKFAPAALTMLKTESAQYIQWELMDGNLETRQGNVFRDEWDIWLPTNLLAVMEFPEGPSRATMEQRDVEALLKWLETGARPKDAWVSNHLVYNLFRWVNGEDTRLLLRIFNAHPQRNQSWWILGRLQDPDALPLLRYWATLPAPKEQAEMLGGVIHSLETRGKSHAPGGHACCQATESCLVEQLNAATAPAETEIHNEAEARAWLNQKTSAAAGYEIHYADDVKRTATVHRKGGTEERWEYLYDCWRRTDAAPESADSK